MKRSLIVALLVGLTACGGGHGPDVRVADVGRGDVLEVVEAPGSVTARAATTVSAPATGTVAALLVQDGQVVSPGQVLMRITSPQALQALAQARKAVTAAQRRVSLPSAGLGPLQDQVDAAAGAAFRSARQAAALVPDAPTRARVLADIAAAQARYAAASAAARAVPTSLGASVESALDVVGGAQRVQADAVLLAAQAGVDALLVKAPQAGVVSLGGTSPQAPSDVSNLLDQLPAGLASQVGGSTSSSTRTTVATGAPVTKGQALLTVTDTRGLGVTAEVDETDVLLVKAGITAGIELDAVPGSSYTGKVLALDVTPSTGARGGVTYRVRLSLVAPRGAPQPLPGMSAVVDLRVREAKQVVTVPSAAVVRVGAQDAVFLLVDGTYRQREVVLGVRGEDAVQVRSGVVVGDRVVTADADQLKDGQHS